MRALKLALLSTAFIAGGLATASAQNYQPVPGETGTPADLVTVPLGVAGSVAGAAVDTAGTIAGAPFGAGPAYQGRSAYGETGTPADLVTAPVGLAGGIVGGALGTAGAIAGAPLGMNPAYQGRSAYVGSEGFPGRVPYINGDYQHLNEPAAPAGGVSETGRKTGVAENPRGIGN